MSAERPGEVKVIGTVGEELGYANTLRSPGARVINGVIEPPPAAARAVLSILMRDEFSAPDGTAVTGRRPSPVNAVGATWQDGSGTWTIEDGVARPSSPFADGDYQWLDSGYSDFIYTCRVSSDAGSGPSDSTSAGLIFRRVDDQNYWTVQMDARAGVTALYVRVAGVFSSPLATTAAAASNAEIPLTVIVSGDLITIHVFGQEPVQYTSSQHQSGTGIGIRAGHGAGTPAGVPTFGQPTLLPLMAKHSGNPVIVRGAPGSWKSDMVAASSIPQWDADNARWVMAYSGFDGVTWHTGVAYSVDLVNWTDEPTNPKLSPVPGEGYIAASAGLVKADSRWYMVYQTAPNATAGSPLLPWRIHAADSPDMTGGGTWSRMNGGQQILPDGAPGDFDESKHDPCVRWRTDRLFQIVFAARDGSGFFTIGHSVGPSLLNMGPTAQLPVAPGVTGLLNPSIEGDDPLVYSLYFCYDIGAKRQTLRADTTDGGATFSFLNLVLCKTIGEWDGKQVFDPSAPVKFNGRAYFFYTGADAIGGTECPADIGLATFDLPPEEAGWSLGDNTVTNSKLADVPSGTIKGRVSAGTGDPEDLTGAQVKTLLALNNVSNDAQLKASDLDTDGALTANSDAKVPSQKAVKTYADTKAPLAHNHAATDINSGSLPQARQSVLPAGAYLIAPFRQYPAGNVSCPAPSANVLSVYAYVPEATINVLSVGFDVQVLFSGGLCSIGFYSSDGNNKLIDTGTKSTTSVGAQSAALGAAVLLYANTMYWLAYVHDNTTSAIRGIVAALTGATNILNAGTVQVGTAANAAVAGALPATLGTITGASRPIPMIKLQG